MVIALILILVGIVLIVSNPLLGLIPGILLIVIGLVVGILAALGRGIGAIAGEDALEAFVEVDGAAGPPQAATTSDTTVKPSRLRRIENPVTGRSG